MRVLGCPGDTSACAYYRVEWPLAALAEQGLVETYMAPIKKLKDRYGREVVERPILVGKLTAQNIQDVKDHYGPNIQAAKRYIDAYSDHPDALDYDMLVFQRQERSSVHGLMQTIQKAGVKVVFDIDDDLFNVPDWNPNYAHWGTNGAVVLSLLRQQVETGGGDMPPEIVQAAREKKSLERACERYTQANRDGVLKSMRLADAMTVTTPHLADLYRPYNANIFVLPNQMPHLDWQSVEPIQHDGEVWFGWAGSKTHLKDLQPLEWAVKHVLDSVPNSRFCVVGFPEVLTYMKLPKERTLTFDWAPGDGYRKNLASLDVVWAPSEAIPFNRAKSDIRAMEAWMCLRPVVASPTTYGQTVREAEGGFVAKTHKEWATHTIALLRDKHLRERTGLAGFNYTISQRTYQANAWRWAEVYEQVIDFACARQVA